MSAFGSCGDSSTGSNTSLVATTRIVAGSQTISAGRILTEDDTGMLDEDGGGIIQDSVPTTPVTVDIHTEGGDVSHVLTQDGGDLLDQDGNPLLTQDSSTEEEGDLLGEDDTPILDESSVSAVVGGATPLMFVETSCQYVWVQPKSTNTGNIWLGGSEVEVGIGVSLAVGDKPFRIDIDDVSGIYIIGYVGEGVTFFYGTTTPAGVITDDDSNPITDDSGNLITG